jgi:maleylacetoacetate isomerase
MTLSPDGGSAVRLHTYWRSSAAYRVRIALNLKRVAWEPVVWHLAKGEHLGPAYAAQASFGLVPMLEIDGLRLQQSLAIVEYLEERDPDPALLPADRAQRVLARSLAQLVACEIHPVNNLRVLNRLRSQFAADAGAVDDWYRHWCRIGLEAVERTLPDAAAGPFALGSSPTIVDCFLVPQVYNALRYGFDMTPYPRIRSINAACADLEAFDAARPERQVDAPAIGG